MALIMRLGKVRLGDGIDLLAFKELFYQYVNAFGAPRNDVHVYFALRGGRRQLKHVDRQIDACQGVANFTRQRCGPAAR